MKSTIITGVLAAAFGGAVVAGITVPAQRQSEATIKDLNGQLGKTRQELALYHADGKVGEVHALAMRHAKAAKQFCPKISSEDVFANIAQTSARDVYNNKFSNLEVFRELNAQGLMILPWHNSTQDPATRLQIQGVYAPQTHGDFKGVFAVDSFALSTFAPLKESVHKLVAGKFNTQAQWVAFYRHSFAGGYAMIADENAKKSPFEMQEALRNKRIAFKFDLNPCGR